MSTIDGRVWWNFIFHAYTYALVRFSIRVGVYLNTFMAEMYGFVHA